MDCCPKHPELLQQYWNNLRGTEFDIFRGFVLLLVYWQAVELLHRKPTLGGLNPLPPAWSFRPPFKQTISFLLWSFFSFKELAVITQQYGPPSAPMFFHVVDCAVCTEKYWKGSSFTCTRCSGNIWGKMAAGVAAVATICIAFAALTYITSVEKTEARLGITGRLLRLMPIHSIKIIIVAWQILTQVNKGHMHGNSRFKKDNVTHLNTSIIRVLANEIGTSNTKH